MSLDVMFVPSSAEEVDLEAEAEDEAGLDTLAEEVVVATWEVEEEAVGEEEEALGEEVVDAK